MLNAVHSSQFFQFFRTHQRPHQTRIRLFSAVVIILCLLLGSRAAWQFHQTQPLTESQQSILSSLVGEVSKKTNQTRQKTWSHLKTTLNIRRIQDITQGDFNQAQEILLQKLK